MLTPGQIFRRLRALWRRDQLERDLEDELDFHLQMTAESRIAHGETPQSARLGAGRELGPVLELKDRVRDARGLRPVEDLLTDLRLAWRGLARRPAFTAAGVITLALGVGGVTAVSGAIHDILLTPLPFAQPDRLVVVWEFDERRSASQEVSPGNFLDWRARTTSFENLVAVEPFGLDWISPDGPVTLSTWLVSEGFFQLLGVAPLAGRIFRSDEHDPGRGQVVVLGYALWQRMFGGDSSIVGRTLTLDREPFQVIGIMPRDFDLPYGNDAVWAPKVLEGWEATARASPFYTVIGRLRPDATLDRAQADLDRVASQLAREFPGSNGRLGARLVPLTEQLVGRTRSALLILLGAVGLVLLVAAANVVSLQLARGLDRAREFSVRVALGAGRWRMVRQLTTEAAALALLGSLLGFILSIVVLAVIRRLAPPELPRIDQLGVDGFVLLVALLSGLLTTSLSALAPALWAARNHPAQGLGTAPRGVTASRAAGRWRAALVAAQFGLALVLLVGTGLLLRSFVSLLSEDRGFRTDRNLVVVTQAWSFFPTPPARAEFVRQASEAIAGIPGIEAVGMTSAIPLHESIGAEEGSVAIRGQPAGPDGLPQVSVAVVTSGLFETLGIPLRGGRLFTPDDRQGTAPVMLVNQSFVRRHFAGGSGVGQRIAVAFGRQEAVEREIVGVVGDVRRHDLHEAARPTVYLPHAQAPTGAVGFVVRTAGEPRLMLEQVKRAIWSLNPQMPVASATTMDQLVGESLRERRFLLTLLALFALIGLGLAATGIFGTMSYVAAERTREIGVRMAFGADPRRVRWMVLSRAVRLAGAGVLAGLAGALLTGRLVEGLLYGVRPVDPVAFGGGILVLFGVALGAAWLPARRASRLDPVDALRSE